MGTELGILGLYGLFVIVIILAQVLACQGQFGLPYLVGPRDEGRVATGVAGRLTRAVDNSIVAMAFFAPAVLILAAKGGFTPGTLLAAQAFLLARIVYVLVYAAGIPWIRTLAWLVGFLATAWLLVVGLSAAPVLPAA
jgi:uncharacterized MAPEG superfamily protein